MDIKTLQSVVIEALEDVKAQDIKIFDTVHLTSLFDRVAVVSGTSNRQTKALAASVRDKVKENGGNVLSMEGGDTGEWVLVDLGDMVVHIMQPAIRAYYRLEEIWGEKEVKFGAAKRVSKRTASVDETEPVAKKPGRHLTTANTADDEDGKKPATRKPRTTKSASADTKKPAAKKPIGKTVKVPMAKSTAASKKAAVKRTPAKPAAVKNKG